MAVLQFVRGAALVLAACALTGCGGGSSGGPTPSPPPPPPPVTLTGVFAGGPVQGLRFQTATQTGFTDIDGKFSYRAGEQVTFSIGGIALGSATGAAQVNLFTLLGLTPPATEAQLRAELVTPNNVTDFDRVANRALLLLSLDNDHDPDNGLDVTGWNTKLAGASLSFDQSLYRFAFEQSAFEESEGGLPFDEFTGFAKRHGLNRNVPFDLPLTHLYRSLGITVSVQALTSEEQDEGGDGTTDFIETTEYDAQGRTIAQAQDNGANGISNLLSRFGYDGAGRIASFSSERDDGDDGTVDFKRSVAHTYDPFGNQLREVQQDEQLTGTVSHKTTTTTATYDAVGNQLSHIRDFDDGTDGTIDSIVTLTFSYDATGNELTSVEEDDANGDGVLDSRTSFLSTYDSLGNRLTHVVDFSASGGRVSIVHTYDAAGNRLTEVDETSLQDGTIERRTTLAFTYDSSGNLLSSTGERDIDGDGNARARKETIIFTYDTNGSVLTEVGQTDLDGDGTIDFVFRAVDSYDTSGNRIAGRFEEDLDGDGNADSSSERSETYSSSGVLLSTLNRRDDNADGVTDEISTQDFLYTDLADGVRYLLLVYAEDVLAAGGADISF